MEIVQVNSIKAWLLAARPKTLAGAATPVYWDVPWPMQTAASK